MSNADVILTADHDIATIALNRPHRHNSFVPDMLETLRDSIRICSEKNGVRVIVMRANGRSFSTGGDIAEFYANRDDIARYADRLVGLLNEVICSMLECPIPIVAVVQGQVTGGALGLVLAADVAIANHRASFSPYYVDVGFSPDGGWTAILPDIIGRTRASAVQQLNTTITARQAFDWGLVTHLVEDDDIDPMLTAVCECLQSKLGSSQSQTKRLLAPHDCRTRLAREQRTFVNQITTDEALSGLAAFHNAMSSSNA